VTTGSSRPTLRSTFAVDPSIRLGLELPSLPAPAGSDDAPANGRGDLMASVAAADRSGFGSVWLTGGAHDGPTGTGDACTVASGAAPLSKRLTLGVVAPLTGARSPSVLARDVTALDVVSKGRAALCLADSPRGDAPASEGSHLGRLAEAVWICRALFTKDRTDWNGQWYHLSGAVNRPGPVRPGGPPLLVDAGDISGALRGSIEKKRGGAEGVQGPRREDVARLLTSIDGCVMTGTGNQVTAMRRALDAVSLELSIARVPVIWRGVLPEAEKQGPSAATALHEAGADGLIVLVGRGSEDPGAPPSADRVESTGGVLAPLVGGWTS